MLYEGNFRVLNQGGNITSGNGKIHAANVDSLTILTSLGTNYANSYPNYRGTDPHNEEVAILDAAESKSYETLLENHKKDYKSLFDRVKLDLGESKPTIPTDELLATYAGTKSKALEVLFYQYGRYLLISSSRPGSLPANLQGVWNNSNRAPWSSDHHFNINIQMNYWPAMVTNLSETMTPLIDYIDSLRTPGRISSENIMAFLMRGRLEWQTIRSDILRRVGILIGAGHLHPMLLSRIIFGRVINFPEISIY